MSGIEKILEHISDDAAADAGKAVEAAKTEAGHIVSEGKQEADRLAENIRKQSVLDTVSAAKRIQSAAELKEKRMILQAKQDEIEKVLVGTEEYVAALDDAEYFALMKKMVGRYATGEKGVILFSAKDLSRIPMDFTIAAAAKGLKVGKTPADIKNGFILSYGDIEENCSIESLISASKETLQDKIGQILFG